MNNWILLDTNYINTETSVILDKKYYNELISYYCHLEGIKPEEFDDKDWCKFDRLVELYKNQKYDFINE